MLDLNEISAEQQELLIRLSDHAVDVATTTSDILSGATHLGPEKRNELAVHVASLLAVIDRLYAVEYLDRDSVMRRAARDRHMLENYLYFPNTTEETE